jgi:hypothetical protein
MKNLTQLITRLKTENNFFEMADMMLRLKSTLKENNTERKLAALTGISKSEIHRLLKIARLPNELKKPGIDKWVYVKLSESKGNDFTRLKNAILSGKVTKYSQVK